MISPWMQFKVHQVEFSSRGVSSTENLTGQKVVIKATHNKPTCLVNPKTNLTSAITNAYINIHVQALTVGRDRDIKAEFHL